MRESILHYIWQQKLFTSHSLCSTDGESLEVIDVGKLNTDAGPDFFNAKIRIGNTIWAGNVEIHTLASDWHKHQHHHDKNYDNIILHVVKKADVVVRRKNGEPVPQLELTYPQQIENNYNQLINEHKWIPCADKLKEVHNLFIKSWITSLLTERLEFRTEAISNILTEKNQHREEAFYILLARSFGFNTNSQAFETLARSLPLSVISKHKNDLFQLEALLFGQAGFLEKPAVDSYVLQLKTEYQFLKAKYLLKAMNAEQWKLLRLRPDNFPHLRIAQFAALIHKSSGLFSKIVENPNIEVLTNLFQSEPSEYWKNHYLFGHESVAKTKKLGKTSIHGLLINTVIPFLFYYASRRGNQELKDRSIELFEQLPAENNAVTKAWSELGVKIGNAFDSQALLHLKKYYCDDKKCLRCRICHKILTTQVD